jgi:hypothetical protein
LTKHNTQKYEASNSKRKFFGTDLPEAAEESQRRVFGFALLVYQSNKGMTNLGCSENAVSSSIALMKNTCGTTALLEAKFFGHESR